MKISKKLAFIIICAFGVQITLPYFNAATLKTEVFQILNFVDELYKHDTQEAKNVAQLLEREIRHNDLRMNSVLSDIDIIEIARTVASDTTIDTKLMTISALIAKGKKIQASERKEGVICMVILAALVALAFAQIPYRVEYDTMITRQIMISELDEIIPKMVLRYTQEQKDQTQI